MIGEAARYLGDREARTRLALVAIVCLGFVPPLLLMTAIWSASEGGVSTITGKLPVWDFANLWGGGRLALADRTGLLFDPGAYRAWFRATFDAEIAAQEWSYPPSLLLVAAPLATLPLVPAFVLWSGGTLALLAAALRWAGLSAAIVVLTLAAPSVAVNLIFGQNGAFTAALLVGGLLLADRRPIVGGILLGLLTLKPQLGLLVPVCLLASGNWRAIAAAASTALALIAVSALAFGVGTWLRFFTDTQPMMRAILEAPWPQDFQVNGVSVFLALRAAGADLPVAYVAQAACALAAAALAWRLWRRGDIDPAFRTALTVLLTFLATPYAWAYDMVSYSAALAIAIGARGFRLSPALALLWLWPALTIPFANNVFPATPLIVALALWLVWRQARRRNAAPPASLPMAGAERLA